MNATAPTATATVELIERGYDAFNREDVDAFRELVWDDVEIVPAMAYVDARAYRGYAGLLEWWGELTESVGPVRFELGDISLCGDGCALVTVRVHGRGRLSGTAFAQTMHHVLRIEKDKLRSFHSYETRAEACAAAGVAEAGIAPTLG